ncbi:MAG: domain S-box [Verrucomicrobia bacterium]|nr:domain S-box [Verrucomicrobiota bacterium]
MKSFLQKLDGKLLLLVVLPMLPALVLVFYADFERRNLGAAQIKQEAVQAAELGAAGQEAMIEGIRQLQASLAQLPQYRGTNWAMYQMHFANLLRLYPYYANYGLLDADGGVLVSAQSYRQPVKPCLYFGYPLLDANGAVFRVLFAALHAEAINRAVQRVVLPPEAVLTVLDRNGRILAQTPAMAKAGEEFGLEIEEFQAMRDRGRGTLEKIGSDKRRKLYAFAPVGAGSTVGTYIVVGIPKETAYAAANLILMRNLFLISVMFVLALWAARRYARQVILQPVEALVRASKEITAGNLRARVGLPAGAGQLNQLGASFDDMAGTLQQRRAELEQAEAKFRILVEQSLVGIYVIQGDRFAYVNPKLAEIAGFTAQEMVGQPVLDFIASESKSQVRDNIQKRMDGTMRSAHYMLAMQRKGGGIVQAEVHGVRTEYDGRPAIIGTLLDITDRVRAEAEIHRLNAELEQRVIERTAQLEAANKELEAFSYSVSHDLRAPLRHINGYVEMLKEDAGPSLNAECLGYLDVLTNSTKQMGQLIDDLLAFSKMSRTGMKRQQMNFTEMVEDTRHKLATDTEGRNVVWKQGNLPVIEGDSAMFRQVWVNLLSNAVKYTRPRDPAEIEIGCMKETESEAVFFVRDNGVGFDMQYVQKLFGVFQRLHRANEFEGTGIGLAIVQRIILRHGGRIWVDAKLNEGATFYFSLPKLMSPQPE